MNAIDPLAQRVEQRLLEVIADLLDSEDVTYWQALYGLSDPEPREKSDLHIRMASAAMAEYKQTLTPETP